MRDGKLERESRTGLEVIRVPNGGLTEVFVTVPALDREDPTALLQRLYNFLAEAPELRIVRQDVFGVVDDATQHAAAKAYRLDTAEWPVTWVEEGRGDGCPVAGIQVHAVAGVPVRPVRMDGRVIGTVFEDAMARYCVLGGLRPDSADAPREVQARLTFEKMEAGLALAGMNFHDVCRTWLYLDHILAWYDEFNRVRNRFYSERGVYDRLVPASTGVGGSNLQGTAVIADLLAVRPKDPRVQVRPVASPLQCPALEYGSSFSRAVEVGFPGRQRLYVSGTASIAPNGLTEHVGDVDRQVALTMDVVQAILHSRGMGWADVTRAIGYFKHGEDAPAFARYCAAKAVEPFPLIIAKNDICRDDLLFEVEVDAIRLD